MRRGPAVVLLIALLIASAYGAQRALTEGWTRVMSFSPTYFSAPKPATGPPPLAERLLLITIEGLRTEDAPQVLQLEWLHRQGGTYHLSVPQPAFAGPVNVTLLTGASPATHGIFLPGQVSALQSDTLPAAAQRVKHRVAAIGDAAYGQTVRPLVGEWYEAGTPQARLEAVKQLVSANGPDLLMLHIPELKDLARLPRDSSEYVDMLATLDAELVQILPLIDLKSTAVMVVGLPAKGGAVPLVMAGAGVKQGFRGNGSLIDVAPTAAALLGAPTPLQNDGRPLIDSLQAEGRAVDVITVRYLASKKAVADAKLKALGAPQGASDLPATAAEAESYLQALEQQVKTARFAAWKDSMVDRLPYLAGGALVLLLYLIIVYRQPYGGALLMGTLTFAATFHLIFFLTGGRYAADMAGLNAPVRDIAAELGLKIAASMSIASLVAGFFLSRRGFKKNVYMTIAALHMALATAAAVALPVGVALIFIGWDFPVALPAPGQTIWFLIAALQVIVIGYMSPIWAAVAVNSARMALRFWPLKEIGDPEVNADKVVRLRSLKRSNRAPVKHRAKH